jgi:hypothetical protein
MQGNKDVSARSSAGFSMGLVSSSKMSPRFTAGALATGPSEGYFPPCQETVEETDGTQRQDSDRDVQGITDDTNALRLTEENVKLSGSNYPPSNFSRTGIVHLPPLPMQHQPESQSKAEASRQMSAAAPIMISSREEVQSASNSSVSTAISNVSSVNNHYTTMRFQHVQDADGFHVLTGREGKLTRCEDEVRESVFMRIYAFINGM